MYSWEIEQLLKLKNYLLSAKEYLKICDNSPQIVRITYNPYEDSFTIITNDEYNFKFRVRYKDE